MNFTKIHKEPLAVAAGGGFLGFALRALLYRIGFDDRGILSDTHPLHLLCLALTVAMGVYLALSSLSEKAESPAPHPWARFLLGILGGYFLLIHGLTVAKKIVGILSLIRCAMALAAAGAMLIAMFPAPKKNTVNGVCHSIVCICFAVDMLLRYRVWSGNPQLPDYCFHVLAGVALSLGTYQTLAFHVGMARPRFQDFLCRMALYLSLLCLVGPDPWEFYLGGAFWAAACLLIPVPPAEESEEEESDVPA